MARFGATPSELDVSAGFSIRRKADNSAFEAFLPPTADTTATLNVNTTAVGNVGSGEDDLISYSVPGSSLANNNDFITFEAAGTFANTVNNKRIRVKFGSTTILDTGALAITSAADWVIRGSIVRTTATTFKSVVFLNTSSSILTAYADYTSGTETLANALTLKVTGGATADDDVRQELLITRVSTYNIDYNTLVAVTINVRTGTTDTLVLADAGTEIEYSNSSDITVTIPPNSSVAFAVGTIINVRQVGTGQVTVSPGLGVTLRHASGLRTRLQWSTISLIKRAANEWVVNGDAVV